MVATHGSISSSISYFLLIPFLPTFFLTHTTTALPQSTPTTPTETTDGDTVVIQYPPNQSPVPLPLNLPINKTASWPVLKLPSAVTEWTAMGDSYAAGIGVGSKVDTLRFYPCFRFSGSYGSLLQNDGLTPKPAKFNYPACSGDTTKKILANQFNEHASILRVGTWGTNPSVVTVSLGGNDIGFKELVTRCIYGIPFFTVGKKCADVVAKSQSLVADPTFISNGVFDVLVKAFGLAKDRQIQGFKMYVLGYARFFNENTTQCNNVQGLPAPRAIALSTPDKLTQELRGQLNGIAQDLNVGIQTAVNRMKVQVGDQVEYVPIDDLFDTHRFCDRDEPNARDPDNWFITYGWDSTAPSSDPGTTGDNSNNPLANATVILYGNNNNANGANGLTATNNNLLDDNSPTSLNIAAMLNAMPSLLTHTDNNAANAAPYNSTDFFDEVERNMGSNDTQTGDDAVGRGFVDFVDVFHPTGPGHEAIKQRLLGLISGFGSKPLNGD